MNSFSFLVYYGALYLYNLFVLLRISMFTNPRPTLYTHIIEEALTNHSPMLASQIKKKKKGATLEVSIGRCIVNLNRSKPKGGTSTRY